MKAATYYQYGGPEVLQISEIEKPIPKENEMLIRIEASAVNSADWRLRKAAPFMVRFFFGLFKPKNPVLGIVLAGEVEEVGESVTKFKKGERVFGLSDMSLGTHAAYKCLPETAAISHIPDSWTYQEAASIPFGGHTALYFFKKAIITTGKKVLIYGASGAVGTAAVQLAKHYGAEVTAVCSTANVELVQSLGAKTVIDYTKNKVQYLNEKFEVIFETVNKAKLGPLIKMLSPNGILILGSAMPADTIMAYFKTLRTNQKIIMGEASADADDMEYLKILMEEKKLKPVVDRTYSLEEIQEAHRYVEQGHKKGNVILQLNSEQ